ncbi:thymidylate synthase [Spiroplasma litorale]|uniref:Thymidylate synthase n=1 Tax=Spiroplasma litorale TaxID=216942 RepID=A0A0K1W0S2_9MOLU|nr:thymidylate synthase [Spiroplasma litorale]AKX33925.1 thymidylate synthase [Spiroplasma litorale]
MKQYLDLVKNILNNGEVRQDRTNTGTVSLFGAQSRYDLREGFPLLTTKKMFFKGIVHEMLWFIKGDTNIKYLVDNDVKIWNEWPYELFKKSKDYNGESIVEFANKIKTDNNFAIKYGELGPVYGKQWRNFNGVDQLKNLIENIKNNPFSRRHIINAWNPSEVEKMALPPCHALFQFYVSESGYLDLQLYQRSGDVFLGIPFNIASYSFLLTLVSLECNLKPRYFIHTIGDAHIYSNHIDQMNLQLTRNPLKLPKLEIQFNNKNIFDIKYEDVKLIDYESHSSIKGEIAV